MNLFFRLATAVIFFLSAISLLHPFPASAHTQRITIDPGHGGYDRGGIGTQKTEEKQVALMVALQLRKILEKNYQTQLTRTSDYWLDIADRASQANHWGSDLFISLHTASSFLRNRTGMYINYYEPVLGSDQQLENIEIDDTTKIKPPEYWQNIQSGHIYASTRLAKLIGNQISESHPDIEKRVQGLPLAVLAGVDMPAVLVEVGHLTNPVEEANLNDEAYVARLASAIAKAIDQFLKQQAQPSN